MYGIRTEAFAGKRPDAWIKSTVGIICIDAKFPLDNFAKMAATPDAGESKTYAKQFLKDVRSHLEKVASDYVRPDEGSADFAFMYIPSESVYHFLVSEALDLLREYAKKGVQVVSPLTLSQRIELIKAGVHAKRLSEEARKVQEELQRLGRIFEKVDGAWRTFYETHLKNAHSKATEVDKAYRKLREEFDLIAKILAE
ncbi:MAG TPA: DNA recombination protein RmuC [Desulfobacterales bacterium]|nr:DNA recombination protein RmuC [Desulfobacterales bacterium]